MSKNTNILLTINTNISKIISYLSLILNIKFDEMVIDGEVSYSSIYKNENISIFNCSGFEDDSGIKFSNYNFFISVESYFYASKENIITKTRQQFCFDLADSLFKKFKCNILVIEGVQIYLKEYIEI